jgi:hypothetical protein
MKYIIFNFIIYSIIRCFTQNIPMTINITDELRRRQRIVLISTQGIGMPAKNTYSLSFLEASRTELRSTQRIVLISTRGIGMSGKNTCSLFFLEASRTELRSTKEIIFALELIGTPIIQAKTIPILSLF